MGCLIFSVHLMTTGWCSVWTSYDDRMMQFVDSKVHTPQGPTCTHLLCLHAGGVDVKGKGQMLTFLWKPQMEEKLDESSKAEEWADFVI